MLAEHDLRAVLHDMADDAVSACETVTFSSGTDDARPARRFGAWLMPLGSAAAVLALVVAVTVAAERPRATKASTTGGTVHVTSAATGAPSGSSGPSSAEPDTVTITPQWIAKTVIGMLPKDGKPSAVSGGAGGNAVQVGLNYDDGRGVAGISFEVAYPAIKPASSLDWPCSPADVAGDYPKPHCSTLPDGTQVYEDSTADAGKYANPRNPDGWTIGILRPDGLQVQMEVENGPYDTKYKSTRSRALITEAQMLAIVQNPVWSDRIPSAEANAAADLFIPDNDPTDPIATPAP